MSCQIVQEQAQPIVDSYTDTLMEAYTSRMARKMGLTKYDKELAIGLVTLMYEDRADFSNTFRPLLQVWPIRHISPLDILFFLQK